MTGPSRTRTYDQLVLFDNPCFLMEVPIHPEMLKAETKEQLISEVHDGVYDGVYDGVHDQVNI